MKPIEPGCLVMIISSDNPELVGMTGTVIGRNEAPFTSPDGRVVEGAGWWDVDADHEYLICRPASSLLRIDGSEDESLETEREKEMEDA